VLLGVELVVVHSDDKGVVGVGRRRRNDDPLHPAVEMPRRIGPGGEATGRLDDHVDFERAPRQLLRLALGHDPDVPVADQEVAPLDVDRDRHAALRRVIAQQVRQRLGRGQVVDRHHLDVGPTR
jgi:hypothetical protein